MLEESRWTRFVVKKGGGGGKVGVNVLLLVAQSF